MESEILKLADEVIDQIAAGEVVDRPAHMMKEILENAVDAGASKVDISVSEGGRFVEVLDNGKGVLKADLPKVFDRHATSKITQSNDLWDLHSFGFRGEALATISSVSKMTFASRRMGQESAFEVVSEFGSVRDPRGVSMDDGTLVRVEGLFDNTPARKKFLKSDSAEVTQIKNVVRAMGMSHPEIGFKVKINGKLLWLWEPTDDLKSRVQKILDVKSMYVAEKDYEGFKVTAVFSDPGTTARVSRQMWFFVQDRWVQDRTLQAAVMEAYRSLLMHGEYPYCFVRVQAPADQVDVNIHPTKSQVKFLDSKTAFRSVHYCLRESLEQAPWLESSGIPRSKAEAVKPLTPFSSGVSEPQNLQFAGEKFDKVQFQKKGVEKAVNNYAQSYTEPESPRRMQSSAYGTPSSKAPATFGAVEGSDLGVRSANGPGPITGSTSPETNTPEEPLKEAHHKPWSHLQVIGQIDLTYIVTQSAGKMVLIDQHAAHERVAYERLMKGWRSEQIETQGFLIPLNIDFEESEMEALLERVADIEKMGISIEQAGPTTLSVQSVPSLIKESGVVRALKKLAADCVHLGGSFAIEKTIGDIFATMACHSVVRAGQALSIPEMEQLLLDMDEFPLSGFCPHGRSVSVEKSFSQLEKEFGRRN